MNLSKRKTVEVADKTLRITLCTMLLGMANSALPAQPMSQPTRSRGELIYVVCTADESVPVKGDDLGTVAFSAKSNEEIKPFQGWGENKKVIDANGEQETLVRAQFESDEDGKSDIGWIAEKDIKLKSECATANKDRGINGGINGLNDPRCCHFPITHAPYESYTTGERQFGALRDKGRIHAGADLYGNQNEPILAVAQGKVVRGLYAFYFGTYAIDVRHPGFVVRYGEVSGKRAVKSHTGDTMTAGETVAHMGQLVPRIRPPMLHFELYSGKLSGTLTQPTTSKNKYGRRKDLMNPTSSLERWERHAF